MFSQISTSRLSPEEIKTWLLLGGFLILVLGLYVFDRVRRSRPAVTVPTRVFAKREQVGGGNGISIYTSYYVTFELTADGSRQEFAVSGTFYSSVREDETGNLTYRGKELLGFAPISHRREGPPPDSKWIGPL